MAEEMRKTFAPPWRQETGRKATKLQRRAREAQVQQARAQEEQAAVERSESTQSGRQTRRLGRQQLVFNPQGQGGATALGG